jgi:Domain of unknown function (DUF4167)
MRPGQNRRMRGRNRSKGPNPLTRSYESNGPDVKIRGTAQHIAEKYSQLARDAQASGDPVAAENYLQHAEHYLRIIAAAQEQFRQQFGGYDRSYDDEGDEESAGFGFPQQGDRPAAVQASGDMGDFGSQPQPYDNRPENGARPQRFDRGYGQERGERFDRGERQERGERRDRFSRNGQAPHEPRRSDNGQYVRQESPRQEYGRRDRRQERSEGDANGGLPAFLTNPIRQPIAVEVTPEPEVAAPAESAVPSDASGEERPSPRPRRRRRPRFGEGGQEGAESAGPASEAAETPAAE